MNLFIDIETYSDIDIACGLDNYKAKAELLLLAYKISDRPTRLWDVTAGGPPPEDFLAAFRDPATVLIAHNAAFERTMLNAFGFPTEIEQWQCSMARALSHALPEDLDTLGRVIGLRPDQAKIKDGKRLIRLFCMPQPANRKVRRATRTTHPDDWKLFCDYCVRDVDALAEIWFRLPVWNWQPPDVALWHLDQRINDRGFFTDRVLAEAGARAATTEKAVLASRFALLTGGLAPTQRAKVQEYINTRFGLALTSTAKPAVEPISKDMTADPELREICQIILAANKSSTAKYAAVAQRIGPDGRLRGSLQFAGAGRTRRWAGRGAQFQNLPSRGLPSPTEIDVFIDALKAGCHDLLFDNLMLFGAAALRGLVIAPPKRKLVCADLSNIEGRMLAWVAGEQWKLAAFREYDNGTGPDLYNITANMIIGVDPWKVSKKDRNVFGKVPDLASGYQGGVTGYQTFAKAYGVKMADHWDTIKKCVDTRHIQKAQETVTKGWAQQQIADLGISELEWVASESCKLAWRAKHPATVQFWYALQEAAIRAINGAGEVIPVGRHVKVACRNFGGHRWLCIRLPSGNYLTYFEPAYTADTGITYWGMASDEDSTVRAWVQCFTHGGKMTGNVCQAGARDLLAYNLAPIEQAGYATILSIHDEVITETPDTPDYSSDGLSALLSRQPPWAPDIPLAAAGFEAYRYKKE